MPQFGPTAGVQRGGGPLEEWLLRGESRRTQQRSSTGRLSILSPSGAHLTGRLVLAPVAGWDHQKSGPR